MPNTGFYPTGTAATISAIGVAWSNPTNVQTENDSIATAALSGGNTEILRCTNFDFSRLDTADSIIGLTIQLLIGLSVGSDAEATLSRIQLYDGTSVIGDDQISGGDDILAAYTLVQYGGSDNLMGATPSVSDAQDSGFGLEIVASHSGSTPTVAIRYVRMAVHVANRSKRWVSRSRSTIRGRN